MSNGMNITPEHITALKPNEIFVFGSNLAGRHGEGAALFARKHFGAQAGCGLGQTGQCYAICTKDSNLRVLPLNYIGMQTEVFMEYAIENPKRRFLVTPIGCGEAGYTPEQIAPLFAGAPYNVSLPASFWRVLKPGPWHTEATV